MEQQPLACQFWDCECIDNYIHPHTIPFCPICGSCSDEMPDSHVSEVETRFSIKHYTRADDEYHDFLFNYDDIDRITKIQKENFAKHAGKS